MNRDGTRDPFHAYPKRRSRNVVPCLMRVAPAHGNEFHEGCVAARMSLGFVRTKKTRIAAGVIVECRWIKIMAISKRTGKKAKAGRIGDVRVVKNLLSVAAATDLSKIQRDDHWYHLRVQFERGQEADLLFTNAEVARALRRAKDNPEDVPSVSRIRDMLD